MLDEADHMFDMGFLPDIRAILARLPAQRQNLLFSATMPREIRHLADELLHQPHVVELAGTAPGRDDRALAGHGVRAAQARPAGAHAGRATTASRPSSSPRTKRRARHLAEQLCAAGHRAVGIQGNLSQSRRDQAMKGFRSRQYNILVATDIVARGIDVSGVSHVINFDVPNTPEAYTHRIGRTGRAEREGTACTFVTGNDHGWLRATERMIGASIERRLVAGFEAEAEPRSARPAARQYGPPKQSQRGGGGGGGRSYGQASGSRRQGDSSGQRRRRYAG